MINKDGDVNGEKISKYLYDFETQQSQPVVGDEDKKIHVVNLCIAHKICSICFNERDFSVRCVSCGIRKFIFDREPVHQLVDLIMNFVESSTKLFVSHTMPLGSIRTLYLNLSLINMGNKKKPSLILNGSKIILMEFDNVKFIDSLLYFHLPLSNLPKAYGLPDISKGNFCHLFTTPENQNYVCPIPAIEMFSPDTMSKKSRDFQNGTMNVYRKVKSSISRKKWFLIVQMMFVF